MHSDWMLDVINDLRTFADLNRMPRAAAELARVSKVAREELRERRTAHDRADRIVSGPVVAGEDA